MYIREQDKQRQERKCTIYALVQEKLLKTVVYSYIYTQNYILIENLPSSSFN